MLEGKSKIQEHYRRPDVACRYVEDRFNQPLGALLHARQLAAMLGLIHDRHPKIILDLAAGPARISVDLAQYGRTRGIAVDASSAMISLARARLERLAQREGAWNCVLSDAFMLPFVECFDIVYSFRFIRHFRRAARIRLYKECFRVLNPDGLFVFDAVNRKVSKTPSSRKGESELCQTDIVYDALLSPQELTEELDEGGFQIISLKGVLHCPAILGLLQIYLAPRWLNFAHLSVRWMDLLLTMTQPEEWIVICRRK
jgi:ubiquinone/menaquinone biosynthesis C-methylase UbiE